MAMLPAGRNPLLDAFTIGNGKGIPARINVNFFFDRASVQQALDKAIYRGLYSAGSVVMQISRRSIKKMGLAKPKLREMKANPYMSLGQLLGRSDISDKRKAKIRARIWEIKSRDASPIGTPPHTHLGTLRNSITYQYDPSSESVVVGSFMQGAPFIAALHEQGGKQRMAAWSWIPKYDRGYKGILAWYPIGRGPKNRKNWELTSSFRETFAYPKRPFMVPAMLEGINSGRIAKEFANKFRTG